MKKLLPKINVAGFILLISISAMAQDKAAPVLPANASLPETRQWLEESLGKYGKDGVTNGRRKKISNVTLSDCRLSYQTKRRISSSGSNWSNDTASSSALGRSHGTNAPSFDAPSSHSSVSKSTFDLKRISADSVRLVRIGKTGMMRVSVRYEPPPQYFDLIKERFKNGSPQWAVDGKYLVYGVFSARENVAEQLKEGFLQMVRSCSEYKDGEN